jgi:cytoskeleton protein RodZ
VFEIGNSLREARLRQGLEFPEIEHTTKIRSKYLRALEDEQFDVLPAQTYVKGFLRTYAEYLGLDGQLYVDEYNSRYVAGEDENPLRATRSSSNGPERRIQTGLVFAVVAGIAILAALVIAAWKFGGGSGNQAAHKTTTTTKKHHPSRLNHQRRHGATSVALDLRGTHGSGSYLEVRVGSAGGKQLFAGTVQPGQKQFFRSSKLWFRVAAPANVAVRVNGVRRKLPGFGYPRVVIALPGGQMKLASATG